MPSTIYCTVCSKEKDPRTEALPALERYLGGHIRYTHALAEESRHPLYILSGRFGLVHASDPVMPYDFLLRDSGVPKLVQLLKKQLLHHQVSSVQLYCKSKESWRPYRDALVAACQSAGVAVRVIMLPENA